MKLKVIFSIFKCLILITIFGSLWAFEADASEKKAIKAIVFDAFPIFDPRPVEAVAAELFPEKGNEFIKLWRSKQFEYQWLRALGEKYKDFKEVTEDALVFAARKLDLPLTDDSRKKLMSPYASLTAWSDAKKTVDKLKENGYKIAFLSNMTEEMLRSGLAASGLDGVFDGVYSTDSQQTFKPSPQAYQIALDKLGLAREEILFVAFAGWDAAGAKWFGYPTFWVNRAGNPQEELGDASDGTGQNLEALLKFLDDDSMIGKK